MTAIRLLVVDDSEPDAELLQRYLHKGGIDTDYHRVDTAETMLSALADSEWDLIVSDFSMPRFDGFMALSIAKQDPRNIPFMIVSGNITKAQAETAMGVGACHYVNKSDLSSLIPAINRQLIEHGCKHAQSSLANTDDTDVELRRLEKLVEERTRALNKVVKNLEHEIDARRQIETALVDATRRADTANRAKSEFLANMSHELRTPLNSIIGFTELLMLDTDNVESDDSKAIANKEKLSYILDSGWHLLSLINDILDLSRIEAGQALFEPSEISISSIIDSALNTLVDRIDKAELSIEIKINESLNLVRADERKLKQVLLNLIGNAVKFTPAGGKILVSAEPGTLAHYRGFSATEIQHLEVGTGQFIIFKIIDTGIGIEEQELAKLFQPFQQLDTTLTRHYEGSGLGLYLCRQLIELHSGFIRAESKTGIGSTFSFIIPNKLNQAQ